LTSVIGLGDVLSSDIEAAEPAGVDSEWLPPLIQATTNAAKRKNPAMDFEFAKIASRTPRTATVPTIRHSKVKNKKAAIDSAKWII
jgi:hypothetical protein